MKFDHHVGLWRGGFEEREGFCSGVVVKFGGKKRVTFLELVEDFEKGGGDFRRRFGHLKC